MLSKNLVHVSVVKDLHHLCRERNVSPIANSDEEMARFTHIHLMNLTKEFVKTMVNVYPCPY